MTLAIEAQYADILTSYIPRGARRRWRYYQALRAGEARRLRQIEAFRDCHLGRRAFILGNAPSIGKMDLSPLRDEVTLAVNSTFRLYPRMGFQATYTCVTDRIRWHELRPDLLEQSTASQIFYCDDREAPSPPSMLTADERKRVVLLNQAYLLPMWMSVFSPIRNRSGFYFYRRLRDRRFSWDVARGVVLGMSSIFTAVQIAAYMGCNPIVLLGVEMDYSGPAAHFHGKAIHTPGVDYERDAKPLFIQFRRALAGRGVRFLNATPGGKVDDLERVDFDSLFLGQVGQAV